MAKEKDKPANEKLGKINVSNNRLQVFPPETANIHCSEFDCSENFLDSLAYAPGLITDDLICRKNKSVSGENNILNQFHLGAGRFDSFGGPEDKNQNRPVKVGGSFITDSNVYKSPKIYDLNVAVPTDDVNLDSGILDDDKNLIKIKYKIGNDDITLFMVIGIQEPKFGFDLKGLPEFEARGQYGYGSRGNGQPVHGFFVQRLGLNGPHGKPGNKAYGGFVPPDGFKGWGDPPFNFKNYINWGFFEAQDGTGGGSESKYKWGPSQANGVTVYQGKQYGAKTYSHSSHPCYYYLNDDPKMYRAKGGDIFRSLEGQTVSVTSKASFFENIRIAITGARTIITNNQSYITEGYVGRHPFFGKLDDGTYFAGVSTNMIVTAQKILDYFKKEGKKVEWTDCGDGGGSAQIARNGKMIEKDPERYNRPVATVIGW